MRVTSQLSEFWALVQERDAARKKISTGFLLAQVAKTTQYHAYFWYF